MSNRHRWLNVIVFSIMGGILACNMPIRISATPFVFPTPNLAMTALFNPSFVEGKANIPTKAVQTSTPVDQISPTPKFRGTEKPTLFSTTPTATISSFGPGMRSGTSLVAKNLTATPKINGDLSDWNLQAYPASHVVYGKSNWDTDEDLSATVMVGWDEKFLYLGCRVKDDKYVQNQSGEYLYLGDSIEVLMDTEVSEDFYSESLNTDDFQLGVSPGSPNRGNHPEAYLWFPRAAQGKQSQVQIGIFGTLGGYQIELAIPWEVFEVDPYSGQHLGFAFSVSDNDNSNQDIQESMISNVSTRVLSNPMTWGDLTLSE